MPVTIRRPDPAEINALSPIPRIMLGLLAVLLLLVSIATATPAHAALTVRIARTDGIGVAARNAPLVAARDGRPGIPEGATVVTECWTWGDSVGPNANRLWWRVSHAGRQVYVADRYLTTPNLANQPPAGEPQCGAASSPSAIPPNGTYVTHSQPLRVCANPGSGYCLPAGSPTVAANSVVTMVCWKDAVSFTGRYSSPRWFWLDTPAGSGYVHSSYVERQSTVSNCSSKRAWVAADEALARAGQQWASAADQALFAASEWKPGPLGEWAGDCPKLPYLGWYKAGVTIPKRNAIANYSSWANSGRIKQGVPPRGAVVFWNLTPQGHTALGVGNGFVVTTRGLDGSRLANEVVPYTTFTGYLGWAMPA